MEPSQIVQEVQSMLNQAGIQSIEIALVVAFLVALTVLDRILGILVDIMERLTMLVARIHRLSLALKAWCRSRKNTKP